MKNPFPMVSMALLVLACAMFVSSAHAQVLGWRLTLLDLNRGTTQTVDVFQGEQDCLAARDYIRDGLRPSLKGTIILTCGPVRPA